MESAARRPESTEDTSRTLAVAIALWGALCAAAARSGALAGLSLAEHFALVAFAILFATATYCLDRRVRGLVDAIDLRLLAAFAVAADGVVAAGALAPAMALVVFVAPLTGAAQVALAGRLIRARYKLFRDGKRAVTFAS